MELRDERRAAERLLSIVYDDESMRESLLDFPGEFGFVSRASPSAEEFLASDCVGQTRCRILKNDLLPGRRTRRKLRYHADPRWEQLLTYNFHGFIDRNNNTYSLIWIAVTEPKQVSPPYHRLIVSPYVF
jgi:hypothetical protein